MADEPTFNELTDRQERWYRENGVALETAVTTERDPATAAELRLLLNYLRLGTTITPARLRWLDEYLGGTK